MSLIAAKNMKMFRESFATCNLCPRLVLTVYHFLNWFTLYLQILMKDLLSTWEVAECVPAGLCLLDFI